MNRKEVITLLLYKQGDNIEIIEEVVKAIAGIRGNKKRGDSTSSLGGERRYRNYRGGGKGYSRESEE